MENLVGMNNYRIPIFRPRLPTFSQIEPYIKRIDNARIYSNFGPLEKEVVIRISDYLGMPPTNIATCANATLALEGALETSVGSLNWELPSWTFTATASAVARSRRYGKFVDVDKFWRMGITSSSEQVIDVLPFGATPRSAEFYSQANLKNVVIDAAASFDSLKEIQLNANVSISGVISFHATKVLPAGEGAIFFSNDESWSSRFTSWTKFGMRETRNSENVGTNSKLSEYHSAVLLASLDAWENDKERWTEQQSIADKLAKKYDLELEPNFNVGTATPYFILVFESFDNRERMREICDSIGIQTRLWWESGCHEMPAYSKFERSDLTNSEYAGKVYLGLPFWIDMQEEDWKLIENAFLNFSSS